MTADDVFDYTALNRASYAAMRALPRVQAELDATREALAAAQAEAVACREAFAAMATEWERLGSSPIRHEAGYPGYPTLESETAATYRECAAAARAALTGAGAESGGDTPDANA